MFVWFDEGGDLFYFKTDIKQAMTSLNTKVKIDFRLLKLK